jgi:hypothetical protein
MRGLARRLSRTFGIDAQRVAVRPQLSWRWKLPALLALLLVVAGMWWWGFDFGQFLGGFNRSEVEPKMQRLERENASLRAESEALRLQLSSLESDLNMARGAQASLSSQALELQAENTQLKEELAFLQKLVSDTGKEGTVVIQRLAAEPEGEAAYRFRALLVRGGSREEEFTGQLALQATLLAGGRTVVLTLPQDDAATATALALRFKYYQRVEGTFKVPAGSQLRSLQARVLEPGRAVARATRTLNLP